MHDNHKHHSHEYEHEHGHNNELSMKLQAKLEHWIDHGDSHAESYMEWAGKASAAGEEEVAKEIYLAIADNDSGKGHLKRAKAILAAKSILKR